ncbi:MAG: ParB-like nuclease domain-containing protein [Bacteroidaceae bacterium]|nr:ParB-like nuclease domain-containing protein [Bacteroidaceae bacterium]
MKTKAFDVFCEQRRFDLIFKYLYVDQPFAYVKDAYLESIRAFNDFHELHPSDGIPKETAQDFIERFDGLICSLKEKKYDPAMSYIPKASYGEITDGAHRLAACAALGLDVEVVETNETDEIYDYLFFFHKGMDPLFMDYGALEYVKLNPNAYIVNLHSITNPNSDEKVERILEKYGFIYYKKAVKLTYNGYVNLKKLSYGSFWEESSSWIGNVLNSYAGAQEHAQQSKGKYPLRAYVFVCDSIEKVIRAKKEIRDLYGKGNYSIHINDTHTEAVWLAETFFNKNSLAFINNRPFEFEDRLFDENIEILKKKCEESGVNLESICAAGSTPLNVFGVRKSHDIDYLSLDDSFALVDEVFSSHDSQLSYYPYKKEVIITNPNCFFYYHGIKFISLDILYKMKRSRREKPKDYYDCRLIKKILFNQKINKRELLYHLNKSKSHDFLIYFFNIFERVLKWLKRIVKRSSNE